MLASMMILVFAYLQNVIQLIYWCWSLDSTFSYLLIPRKVFPDLTNGSEVMKETLTGIAAVRIS